MALTATGAWEIRTAGSDTQGGFYAGTGGTDYSQQDTAQLSLTDVVTNGTGTVTSATGGFTSPMIGNGFNIAGNIFQVSAVASNNSLTVLANNSAAFPTSASGQTGKIGGACASPGYVAGQMAAGNDVHCKAGTYLVTSVTTNISGGCINSVAGVSAANMTKWLGYQNVRGDGGTKPIFRASGIATFNMMLWAGNGVRVENIEFDGANLTTSRGISVTAFGIILNCRFRNCTNSGISSNEPVYFCEITGCSTLGATTGVGIYIGCVSHDNTTTGFGVAAAGSFVNCISYNNSGASSDGFFAGSSPTSVIGCTAFNNGRHGFNAGVAQAAIYINSLAVNNAGYGFSATSANDGVTLYNNAGYNNISGPINTGVIASALSVGFMTLTAPPLDTAAIAALTSTSTIAQIFAAFGLNNFGGGGGALRGQGVMTGTDVGAVQHSDPIKFRGRRGDGR